MHPCALIIDRNRNIRSILGARLAKQGFNVISAANRTDGLRSLYEKLPSSRLLGTTLPAIEDHGYIAVFMQFPAPPVLYVIGEADDFDLEETGQHLKADHILTKGQVLHPRFAIALWRRVTGGNDPSTAIGPFANGQVSTPRSLSC